MHGKKGADMVFTYVIGGLIGAALIVVVVAILRHSGQSTSKVMNSYTESLSSDYDGDDMKDLLDKSPCVAGEELVMGTDGKQYTYFGDLVPGRTVCDNVSFPDLPIDYKLKLVTEQGTTSRVCVLEDRSCAIALKTEYEAMRVEG